MLLGRPQPATPLPAPTHSPSPLPEKSQPSQPSAPEQVSEGSITIEEMLKLKEQNQPVHVLDVRADRSYESSNLHAKGAIRIHPDEAVRRVSEMNLDKDAWLIAFCA